jgi:type I restriction enzyme M protein
MLDTETKRRIDCCRDILVGKIPDPKGQVEQITIALVYKFMDDMDTASIEMGGEPAFFVGDYEQYSWARMFDSRLGSHEQLLIYSEAIQNMSKNPALPQLFRDIFKNAFLPFRDPHTLKLFLTEINIFTYDHSERLGDAFEYLLSVLGSQGDAGQFRTPRHIIDFIVSAVNPGKTDTVCDPACGTAGFLISAYKHILRNNPKITQDAKKKLFKNFVGYDISSDMVRLSLVNMYLHGFNDPRIHEYDTLTSEQRWDDDFDVILANPPFMTPKGGIRPHGRFAISAKRSEVLFVDYIAEHLSPKGRAGIIVPEGIIFQGQNAYKNLRKMLLDGYLWAVVSLPSGVFQPYSGVKTSILLLDKELAKRTRNILFAKVDNDGFSLGAQRQARDGSQLAEVLETLERCRRAFVKGEVIEATGLAHCVSKKDIDASGDYNLTGDRYKTAVDYSNLKWPMVELGKVITTITPPIKIKKEDFCDNGRFPIIDQSQKIISGWHNNENAVIYSDAPLVIFGDHTCVVKYVNFPFIQGADGIKILRTNNLLLPKFLYFSLRTNPLESDGYKRHFGKLKRLKIPLPPLEVQERIVAKIEAEQRMVDECKKLIEIHENKIKAKIAEVWGEK